ncbi:hypothetical protein KIH39_23450 [Telmatocola sphagniphila]|uniref:Uncharacterized protein n=1 Tax=Telmatocola sphagniphila TaxID=1123043 RepID=A0A8E6EUV1_9BACT|nr:hypothetical protein [Telmatocola sphagniphila]QVL31762.1 hypothetical protein KIH39_23450 [Telmatocola sphagniphila]
MIGSLSHLTNRCEAVLLTGGSDGSPLTRKIKGKAFFESKRECGDVGTFPKSRGDQMKWPSNEIVEDNGTLEWKTFAVNDCVSVGDLQIAICWDSKQTKGKGNDHSQPGKSLLNPRYYKTEISGLTATITKTSTALEQFEWEK